MTRRAVYTLASVVLVAWATALLSACTAGPSAAHRSVLEIVRESSDPIPAGSPLAPEAGMNVVAAHTATGVAPFGVLARESRVPKTPCAGCHTKPLKQMRWDGSDGRATAHWRVELVHAARNVMSCATCHTPDAPGTLRLLGGDPLSFDHAYQVCAQCHSKQRADWEGGAHGKRAIGWGAPRSVFGCTECHNPHRPALDSRWPARAGRTDR